MLYGLLLLIWSTGFIAGKGIVGLIDPNVYLALRFFATGLIFFLIAIIQKRSFPIWADFPKHILAGALLNGLYLGFAYTAVRDGLPAGVMALIGALQPVLVMFLAFLLIKEKLSLLGVLGMLVAIGGLLMVISPSLSGEHHYSIYMVLLGCLAIFCLALGAVYQKMSIARADIVTSLAIQNGAASVVSLGFILVMNESLFTLNLKSIFLLGWGVLVLSCGGVFLFVWLLRKSTAAQVSTSMLLVPPLAVIESYLIFGESMTMIQIVGIIITLVGVYFSYLKPGQSKIR